MSFGGDINKFIKKVDANNDKAFRGTVLGLFGSIIKLTPVGNPDNWKSPYKPKGYVGGRLRGNWQLGINSPVLSEISQADPTGGIAVATATAASQSITAKNTAYISNNLPYAEAVEDGSSSQAPNGMVKTTVAKFDAIVKANARKVNK